MNSWKLASALKSITFLVALQIFMFDPEIAAADGDRESVRVGITAGDGKNVRVFAKWDQPVQNRPVQSVSVRVQKRSGGNDTFLNLRFGSGQTFENGRRIYLTNGAAQTVTWNVGGASSGGQPLVLNAYNGEVDVIEADINYTQSQRPPRDRDDSNRPGSRDDDSDDRDSDDRDFDERPGYPPGGYGGRGDSDAGRRCRDMRIRPPRIEIGQLKPTGGLFSGKYKFEGAISGICIEEAGYYEKGRLKERIEIPMSDQFKRQEFNIKVRTGERGEIRVFTSDGKEEFVPVDEEIERSNPY